MRLISGTLLLALTAGAHAHTLAGDESLVVRLGHQLIGSHHLPLTILLALVAVIAFRQLHKSFRTDRRIR